MKFALAFAFAILAVSAFAEESEFMENFEVDWSKALPIQDMPGISRFENLIQFMI